MPHIGKLIQEEVEKQRLTQKQFGALINKNEKTVPDIYDRPTMAIDLIVTISDVLDKDFLKCYYAESPMKRFLEQDMAVFYNQLQKRDEEIERLKRELKLTQELVCRLGVRVLGAAILSAHLTELARPIGEQQRLSAVGQRRGIRPVGPVVARARKPSASQLVIT